MAESLLFEIFHGSLSNAKGKYKAIHFRMQCAKSKTEPGDGLDNDCDGAFDEELLDGNDNDGDGKIDEDVALVKCYYKRSLHFWTDATMEMKIRENSNQSMYTISLLMILFPPKFSML